MLPSLMECFCCTEKSSLGWLNPKEVEDGLESGPVEGEENVSLIFGHMMLWFTPSRLRCY